VQLTYPKRLIEVDLPIRRISAHARREKSIRHGHISTLHIWWARRPLAACRAVICAALWPDPADELCPESFRQVAEREMRAFAKAAVGSEEIAGICDDEAWERYGALTNLTRPLDLKTLPLKEPDGTRKVGPLTDLETLRGLLLDFIADFAAWESSINKTFLQTARNLTQAAHEALGGAPGTRPLIVDPFAGGGSIPLEALRVGADAFASDLNPVAVLLNKVVLEYIPKYGQRLADEVRKWGQWIKQEAEKELAEFYPKDPDGATPIAYLWARTIKCEGPGCGAEVPLIKSLWLAKRHKDSIALRLVPHPKLKTVEFEIIEKAKNSEVPEGTVRRSSALCPVCGYTTPAASMRRQMKERKGGTLAAKMACVVTHTPGQQGRRFRLSTQRDREAVRKVQKLLEERKLAHRGMLSLVPDEPVNPLPHSVNRLPLYGMTTWGDLFTSRQALALSTFIGLVKEVGRKLGSEKDRTLVEATKVCLALAVDRVADRCSSLCRYDPSPTMSGINNTFARQALPMVWDFGEGDPNSERSGGWEQCLGWLLSVLEREAGNVASVGTAAQASASMHPLPDDSANAFVTDPPYFDMICYADLSDFFYVWLRRALGDSIADQWKLPTTPKADEIIVEPTPVESVGVKDESFYLKRMTIALSEGRRVLRPNGVGVVVFAHKSTSGWESLLQALMDGGWIITGSWPIDTEMANKVAGIGQARLMSSVHLVCRPRENPDGSVGTDEIGDWRDVLGELPRRIHEWMPRLADEGVVGADAIFACLGPALEIFSRYSRVEKASGEAVTLREYLEQVWAAVAKEALTMIFAGADATGFEEDARLTAMWLWTLHPGNGNGKATNDAGEEEEADEEESGAGKKKAVAGYALEYDAARKIAQGLGAHLEKLAGVVEVKGDTARLLSVSERTGILFGKDQASAPSGGRKKKDKQMKLAFEAELDAAEAESGGWGDKSVSKAGNTGLDRVHQAMILFAAGRSEALRRFLVDDGIGRDQRFWRLAQALSALYPPGTDEKRWVDGVLGRKKGLGL